MTHASFIFDGGTSFCISSWEFKEFLIVHFYHSTVQGTNVQILPTSRSIYSNYTLNLEYNHTMALWLHWAYAQMGFSDIIISNYVSQDGSPGISTFQSQCQQRFKVLDISLFDKLSCQMAYFPYLPQETLEGEWTILAFP